MKKLASQQQIICGLDIGTTKIAAVIAERADGGEPQILGMGCVPSRGLRRGVVVNLEHTASDIEEAVQFAEDSAGVAVDRVWAGLAGEHVRSVNSRGVIPVSKIRSEPTGEVTDIDVERVVEAAKAIALPMDRRILHVLPQEFIVDSECGIRAPIGMAGVRLEADVHIVTCAISSAQNIITCCKRAGLAVQNLVLEPLASADGVLTWDERELGVVLLDFGGGTTDLAVFHNGTIRHTAVIGYGGDYITRDIAMGLRTPVDSAEKIKIEHGAAHHRAIAQNEYLTIPGVGGREPQEMSRSMLVSIIGPRVEEILTMARDELKQSRTLDHIGAGVVLTGGGASMPGMAEIAEEIFTMPVRIGAPNALMPDNMPGARPKYATAVGLIRYADKLMQSENSALPDGLNWPGRTTGKVKKWLSEIF
ncbi:cell division protein FtsA [bacterium]|nr:cell division protein FtsA [bacterium]MBU1637963.1 cell division protein FtsA [bacterium]RQV99480.1 MAG: cell division protein FtsA [bacterium]